MGRHFVRPRSALQLRRSLPHGSRPEDGLLLAYYNILRASLGPTPKNRPGTHCLRMRVINTLNVGIPTFRYTFRVRPLRVTSRRITLWYVSVHYSERSEVYNRVEAGRNRTSGDSNWTFFAKRHVWYTKLSYRLTLAVRKTYLCSCLAPPSPLVATRGPHA